MIACAQMQDRTHRHGISHCEEKRRDISLGVSHLLRSTDDHTCVADFEWRFHGGTSLQVLSGDWQLRYVRFFLVTNKKQVLPGIARSNNARRHAGAPQKLGKSFGMPSSTGVRCTSKHHALRNQDKIEQPGKS
jgi:hypothetical protein